MAKACGLRNLYTSAYKVREEREELNSKHEHAGGRKQVGESSLSANVESDETRRDATRVCGGEAIGCRASRAEVEVEVLVSSFS